MAIVIACKATVVAALNTSPRVGQQQADADGAEICDADRRPFMNINVDCANGVGGLLAHHLSHPLNHQGLSLKIHNSPHSDPQPVSDHRTHSPSNFVQLLDTSIAHNDQSTLNKADATLLDSSPAACCRLNHKCGSDYVQTARQWPQSVSPSRSLCCSFDGDGDRIVFYFARERGEDGGGATGRGLFLLDGDYVAALVAWYAKRVVAELGLNENIHIGEASGFIEGRSNVYVRFL
jgi:phosphomannomutase